MKETAWDRAIRLAEYIVDTKNTVRKTAAVFGISKSTVHKDVTERLRRINPPLYREVSLVLEQNKQERHMRGGEATRRKYINRRTLTDTEEKE